jgi:hypothetical protein
MSSGQDARSRIKRAFPGREARFVRDFDQLLVTYQVLLDGMKR